MGRLSCVLSDLLFSFPLDALPITKRSHVIYTVPQSAEETACKYSSYERLEQPRTFAELCLYSIHVLPLCGSFLHIASSRNGRC